MYRHAAFLVRKEGMSHEAFLDHWQTEHTPIAREIEGVVRYHTTVPIDPETATFDGLADLYFEDLEALHDALGGEGSRDYDPEKEVAAKARADVDNFLAVTERPRLIGEETVRVTDGDAPYKRAILLPRRADMSHEQFRTYWLEEHLPLVRAVPGLVEYRTTLPTEPAHAEFDGIAELCFADEDALWASMGRAVEGDYDPDHPDVTAVTEDSENFLAVDRVRQFVGRETVQKDVTG
jgi:uncharacterized protein (TIGR02118 family)